MENLDLLIFNFIILFISVWIILYTNRNFIYKTRINKKRFRLFSLRDDLTLLVMAGKVEYNSKEYQYLLHSLNSVIKITGDFQISDFLKFLITQYNNDEIEEKLDKIDKAVEVQSKEFKVIWVEYHMVMGNIMSKHLRLLVGFVTMLASLLLSIKIFTNAAKWLLNYGSQIKLSTHKVDEYAKA